jgi:hypothetical protein
VIPRQRRLTPSYGKASYFAFVQCTAFVIIRVPEATLSPGFVIPSGQNRIRRSVFLFSIKATASSVPVIRISAIAFLEVEKQYMDPTVLITLLVLDTKSLTDDSTAETFSFNADAVYCLLATGIDKLFG